ncbi:hypothetical protein Tco_1194907 [Tanacetum coccineum]
MDCQLCAFPEFTPLSGCDRIVAYRIYVRGVSLLLAFACSRFGALVITGRPVAEYRGGGTGERVGRGGRGRGPRRGNDERVDELNGQGNGQGRTLGMCYDGKGGVVVLTRWMEKMESVQDMRGCSIDQKVKYTAGSLQLKAFNEVKLSDPHANLGRMQKLETGLWNSLPMVGAGHAAYTDRFHELARLVPHLVTLENRKIERYMYSLAPQICRMVAATVPKTMQKAVQISGALTDEAVGMIN